MIKNKRQYQITLKQYKAFSDSIAELKAEMSKDDSEAEKMKRELLYDALISQRADLGYDMDEYQRLKGKKELKLDSLSGLPSALIQARIAAGFTQKELAKRTGLKEQQIQRYEANDYAPANLERLQLIADALGVTISGVLTVPQSAK